MNDCVFCKVIKGELPSQKTYEDKDYLIIRDISPKSAKHYLIIPKEHYTSARELDEKRGAVLTRAFIKIASLEDELGLSGGYRLVTNAGADAYQTVQHLHVHVLGGQKLSDRFGE